jgi:hypothetical protein
VNCAANGTLYPCRFFKNDPALVGAIVQSGAGDPIFGITQKFTDSPPLNDGVFPVNLDTGYAAIAGEMCGVYTFHDRDANSEVLIETGAAITNLQYPLKSDSQGRGIPVTSAGDQFGCYPLQFATGAGFYIKCTLVPPNQSYSGGVI